MTPPPVRRSPPATPRPGNQTKLSLMHTTLNAALCGHRATRAASARACLGVLPRRRSALRTRIAPAMIAGRAMSRFLVDEEPVNPAEQVEGRSLVDHTSLNPCGRPPTIHVADSRTPTLQVPPGTPPPRGNMPGRLWHETGWGWAPDPRDAFEDEFLLPARQTRSSTSHPSARSPHRRRNLPPQPNNARRNPVYIRSLGDQDPAEGPPAPAEPAPTSVIAAKRAHHPPLPPAP